MELSVNLEYMFTEAGENLEDRIAAAANAGFNKVEIFSTLDRDLESIKAALQDHEVSLISVVADPRTRLYDRETHPDFEKIFHRAASDALFLGCANVVCGSGPAVPFLKRVDQIAAVSEAFERVAPIAKELGAQILLEAVNIRVDHPGVLFSATEDVVNVARAVNSDQVGILYDMYHSIVEGEDPSAILPPIIDLVRHVQIADVPGRGEPGSGAIDWKKKLSVLQEVGYRGVVGVECQPTQHDTPAALQHIRYLVSNLS